VVISCPNPPKQIACLQLLVGGKFHDFTEIKSAFKDEITLEKISYKAWYKVAYRDFLLGRAKYQQGGDSINGNDVVGQAIARIGGQDVCSHEFKIRSKREMAD
jgi:hypothetical protein